MDRSLFPTSLGVDLKIAFDQGIQAMADNAYTQLIEIVPSNSDSKKEVFYGDQPLMQRWRGERQAKDFYEYKLTLNADQWELSRKWKRKDVAHDQSGGVLITKAKNFGEAFEVTKQREFWDTLHNGTSIMGFDKANLFDFNHCYVDSTGITHGSAQSNMHLGGSQLDATTLQLEKFRYTQIQTDQGNVWGLQLTHVGVLNGSLNHKLAMELSNSQFTVEANTVKGQMTENVFRGSFDIITTFYGLGASEWYSFALNMPEFKPIKVLSETVNPGFTNPRFTTVGLDPSNESDESFYNGYVKFGLEANFDYNPGYWFTANLHGSSAYVYTPVDQSRQRVLRPNTWG